MMKKIYQAPKSANVVLLTPITMDFAVGSPVNDVPTEAPRRAAAGHGI